MLYLRLLQKMLFELFGHQSMTNIPNQCPYQADFFQQIKDLLEQGQRFWQYSKHSFRKLDKFLKIGHLVYFSTGLVPN